jgi:nucleoside-diphosphate-sugar epimerase
MNFVVTADVASRRDFDSDQPGDRDFRRVPERDGEPDDRPSLRHHRRGFDLLRLQRRLPQGRLHPRDGADVRAFGWARVLSMSPSKRRTVQLSIEQPRETHEANVTGTLNVLIAAKEGGVKRLVFAASSSAYGDQPKLPLVENMPAMPKSPYGLHKYVGEYYCKVWSEVYGLETVSLRYFNVYGPRLDPRGAYALVIGKFLQLRKDGKPLTITGDGKQTRDFTHVYDVARANVLAATSEKVGKGEVINIGAHSSYSINDVAKLIGGPVEHIPARLEPHDTLADITKAKKLLGWEPKVTFEQGIEELKKLYL